MNARWPRRLLRGLVALAAACGLVALNGPTLVNAGRDAMHDYKINSPGYKAEHGQWSTLDVPEDMRVNAIHAALLRTGKVLIIAGSGNDRKSFDAGSFKTVLWDPKTDTFERVKTPSDMFCAGHAFLPDGKLLIAGGTSRYEKLEEDVKHAAGAMTIKNEDPDAAPFVMEKGAELVSAKGRRYHTTREVTVRPAKKVVDALGAATVTASETEVWVEAVDRGDASVVEKPTQFRVAGVDRRRGDDVYGFSEYLTTEKQEYWGDDTSYLFDPVSERYERVEDMDLARWYPTLVGLADGKVLSVSGLDEFGRIVDGQNEIYDPATKRWTTRPDIKRTFPTYPSLFLMPGGDLFYTGSNAGYGSDTVGRDPGVWDLGDNSFRKVPGLRDPRQTETSGSVLLPPAQDQRYMVAGGGGIGESNRSTARTDVVDLRRRRPRFRARPEPGRAGALPEHGAHARRQGRDQRRVEGLPRPGQQRRAPVPALRPEDRPHEPHGRPDRGAQLPLAGAAAARRADDHHGQRPALLRRRQHQARPLREAHRDLVAALPVRWRAPSGDGRPRVRAARAAARRSPHRTRRRSARRGSCVPAR